MKDHDKSKEQLIAELEATRQIVAGFQEAERGRNAVLEFTLEEHKKPPTWFGGVWTWHVSTGQVVFDRYVGSDSEESGKWERQFDGTWEEIIRPDDRDRILAQLGTFLDSPPLYDQFCFWTRGQRYIGAVWEHFFFTDEPGHGPRGFRRRPSDDQQFFLRGTYSDHTELATRIGDDPRLPEVFRAGPEMALIYNYLKNTVPKDRQDALEIINDTIVSPLESTYIRLQNCMWRLAFYGIIPQFLVKAITQFSAAFFIKDSMHGYLYVSTAMAELLGLPQSEILGKSDLELFGERGDVGLEDVTMRPFPWYWPLVGKVVKKVTGETTTELMLVMVVQEGFPWGGQAFYWGAAIRTGDIPTTRDSDTDESEFKSKAMLDVMQKARKVAKEDSTVLLTGESGSGKDHLARYIHDHSGRRNEPYYSINCAALPLHLAETELFGHEKGSFTGAHLRKRGLLEQANGGTIVLNEIGEVSPEIQAKLLQFLETKRFTRVGAEKETMVDVRLIAATNRDLEKEIESGRFRKDLFYRLNVFPIQVPSLKDCREDIPFLAERLIHVLAEEMKKPYPPLLNPADLEKMLYYEWPGNVRELRNVIERGLILARGFQLRVDLPDSDAKHRTPVWPVSDCIWRVPFPPPKKLNELAIEMKRALIDEALRRTGGKRMKAAELLGITRHSLKRQMKTCGYTEPE
jgi:DNA-binding NtrC family response regulator